MLPTALQKSQELTEKIEDFAKNLEVGVVYLVMRIRNLLLVICCV